MSKRWTLDEDEILVRFFDSVGDFVGTHDLGRPKGAASARVKRLKETGAWDALKRRQKADYECLLAYYAAVGAPNDIDTLAMLHPGAPEDGVGEMLLPAMRLDAFGRATEAADTMRDYLVTTTGRSSPVVDALVSKLKELSKATS